MRSACQSRTVDDNTSRSKLLREALRQRSEVIELTFPDDEHPPARGLQLMLDASVARDVAVELALPELAACLGSVGQTAVVAVPETAVDEQGDMSAPEHDIGPARQIPRLQPISVAHRMQEPANGQFRPGVATPDAAHQGATFCLAHDIEARSRLARDCNHW